MKTIIEKIIDKKNLIKFEEEDFRFNETHQYFDKGMNLYFFDFTYYSTKTRIYKIGFMVYLEKDKINLTFRHNPRPIDEKGRKKASMVIHRLKEEIEKQTSNFKIELGPSVIQDFKLYNKRQIRKNVFELKEEIEDIYYSVQNQATFWKHSQEKLILKAYGKDGLFLAQLLKKCSLATYSLETGECLIMFKHEPFRTNSESFYEIRNQLVELGFSLE